jgi:hypothetical protein
MIVRMILDGYDSLGIWQVTSPACDQSWPDLSTPIC